MLSTSETKEQEAKQIEDTQAPKRVHWDPTIVESTATKTFTPARDSSINHTRLKRKVLELIRDKDYETLNNRFLNLTNKQKEEFFNYAGNIILSYILDGSDMESFQLIINHAPMECIKRILSDDNFSILRRLLGADSMMERCGCYDETDRSARIEKFQLLLSLDKEGIECFIENSHNTNYTTPKILEDFEQALTLSKMAKRRTR